MDFLSIEYLKKGNTKQQLAYNTLGKNNILSALRVFDPILVGTIPIEIDIETSDLDIICYFSCKKDFIRVLNDCFAPLKGFMIKEKRINGSIAIVAKFRVGCFEIEIFGQDIPTLQQNAYRHMLIEYQLLKQYGEPLRQTIISLKGRGYKTEPAFGVALGLKGNPYDELLRLNPETPGN